MRLLLIRLTSGRQADDPKQELVKAGDSSQPIGFGPLDDAAIDKRVQQVTRRSPARSAPELHMTFLPALMLALIHKHRP